MWGALFLWAWHSSRRVIFTLEINICARILLVDKNVDKKHLKVSAKMSITLLSTKM